MDGWMDGTKEGKKKKGMEGRKKGRQEDRKVVVPPSIIVLSRSGCV